MSDNVSLDRSDSGVQPARAPRKRAGNRWQIVILIVGLILIAATVVFMLARRRTTGQANSLREISTIQGSVFTEAAVGEPRLINPLLAVSQADRDLASLVYSGLTRLDEFGQPVPDLAEAWEVSTDGLTYKFHLRSGVTWHDGQPFTANDVAFTMSVLRDPGFPGPEDLGKFWQTVETYATDDLTVEFVLTQPLASFPEYAGIGILPAHLLAGVRAADLPADAINLQPIGTGRLWWESMETGGPATVVTLHPDEHFYDAARRVPIETVRFHYYENAGDAFRALGSDAQAYGGLSVDQIAAALASPGLNIFSARLPVYAAVVFNQQNPARPFFQDEDVRQALLLALDRPRMVSETLDTQAILANSTILPGTWAYNPLLPAVSQDTARAAQLLDAAGWTLEGSTRAREGVQLAFTLLVSDVPTARALGESLRDQWGQIGVQVMVEVLPPEQLLTRLEATSEEGPRRFDAALLEFSQGRLADPDPYPFWHSSQAANGQNYGGFSDRDIDEALELARRDPNGVRRAELYRSFQQWFIERAAAILLYNPVYHYAVSCQIDGVQLQILTDPADRFRNLHEWRILPPDALPASCQP